MQTAEAHWQQLAEQACDTVFDVLVDIYGDGSVTRGIVDQAAEPLVWMVVMGHTRRQLADRVRMLLGQTALADQAAGRIFDELAALDEARPQPAAGETAAVAAA